MYQDFDKGGLRMTDVQLFNNTTHTYGHAGPTKWGQNLSINNERWKMVFGLSRKICKETKLKEFKFQFIHRILATKKELFRYGFSTDDECYYCGEKDSIDHTFIHCSFTKGQKFDYGLTQRSTPVSPRLLRNYYLVFLRTLMK